MWTVESLFRICYLVNCSKSCVAVSSVSRKHCGEQRSFLCRVGVLSQTLRLAWAHWNMWELVTLCSHLVPICNIYMCVCDCIWLHMTVCDCTYLSSCQRHLPNTSSPSFVCVRAIRPHAPERLEFHNCSARCSHNNHNRQYTSQE